VELDPPPWIDLRPLYLSCAAAATLIAMQRRGVRVVLRLGPAGQPEFALIRQGGPIPPNPPHHKGLGAGMHARAEHDCAGSAVQAVYVLSLAAYVRLQAMRLLKMLSQRRPAVVESNQANTV